MFLGEFEHTIDDKGRVAVPARFREALGEGLILTRGFERCLQAFPRAYWNQLSEKINALSIGSEQARALRRLLFSTAAEAEVDRQGRILIPQNLREYAGLAEQAVITGMDTYFELWSTERWSEMLTKIDSSGVDIAQQLASLGI